MQRLGFFAPRAKLVVEVDGSQHLVGDPGQKDRIRDAYLADLVGGNWTVA
jgi:very-short-patch-repair endonuclease